MTSDSVWVYYALIIKSDKPPKDTKIFSKMNQITHEQLAIFICVADNASFSTAAKVLSITPKAVSKQIAKLEAILGLSLFIRSTRYLAITSDGEALLAYAKQAHQSIQTMCEFANHDDDIQGVIRLTAPVPFGRKYVAGMIADFVKLYPKISIDLHLSDQVVDIYKQRFDLAIRIGELQDSGLITRRIMDNRRILVASPDYLAYHGIPQTLSELSNHQMLIFAYMGFSDDKWQLQNSYGEQAMIRAKGVLRSDNGDVLTLWCIQGLGISLREIWNVNDALQRGELIHVLQDWQGLPSKISFVYPAHTVLPKRLRVFMAYMIERCQKID